MKLPAVLLGALLALAATGAAAKGDNSYWDFRFGIGTEPKLRHAHYEPDTGPTFDQGWDAGGGSFEFNAAHRFAARGPSSAFVSAGLFARGFDGHDDPDTSTKVSLGAVGVQVGGGYSYWDDSVWSLEVGPHIGIGSASAEEKYEPTGDRLKSDSGGYAKFDLGVANIFTFSRFQFGVTLGAAAWGASVHYNSKTVDFGSGPTFVPDTDARYRGSGFFGNIFFGWR